MSVETSLQEPLAGPGGAGQDLSASDLRDTLKEWLDEPATKEGLQRCADAAIEKLKADLTLRVPRDPEDRADGFAQWLGIWKDRLSPAIQDEFHRQFPPIAERLSPDYLSDMVSELVWPQVKPTLLAFAIRGLARPWVSGKLGDALLLGIPEFLAGEWIVPLWLNGHSGILGQVVLDHNGNIVQERNPTREQLLACLNA